MLVIVINEPVILSKWLKNGVVRQTRFPLVIVLIQICSILCLLDIITDYASYLNIYDKITSSLILQCSTFDNAIEAANAFCEAARLKIHLQSRHEAASFFVDAATCFKKSEPESTYADIHTLFNTVERSSFDNSVI